MRAGYRGLHFAIAVAVFAGLFVSASMLCAVLGSWTTLPVPAGTVITAQEATPWVAHFTVGVGGGTLVGTWTAFDGGGNLGPSVVYGTVSKPQPAPGLYNCPLILPWVQTNGTLDRPLAPGPYTMYWNTFCTSVQRIVVTQTFQVVAA